MENFKTLTYVDENLNLIRREKVIYQDYDKKLRKSLLILITWLNENILSNDELGFNLKKKIEDGIKFNDEWHIYFLESHSFWKEKLKNNHKNLENKSYIVVIDEKLL